MLTFAALLFAQAAPLPAQATEPSAQQCAVAIKALKGEGDAVEPLLAATYYVMAHARETRGDHPFFQRLNELTATLDAEGAEMTVEAATELLPRCDARYPLARASEVAVTLPAGPFERNMLCVAATSLLLGIASAAAEDGNGELLSSVQPTFMAYATRLTPEQFAERSIDESGAEAMIGETLARSLDIGPPRAIGRACAAELDN